MKNKTILVLLALIISAVLFVKPAQAAEASVLEHAPLTEQFITARVEDRWFARIDEQSGSQTWSETLLNDADFIALALQRSDIQPGFQTYKVINRYFDEATSRYYGQVWAYTKTTEETVAIRELKIPVQDLPENFESLSASEKNALIVAWGREKGLVNTAEF